MEERGMTKYFTRLYREIWDDEEFYSLSELGQNVFLYLISAPIGTQFGIFKSGISSLAEFKRQDLKVFRKGFDEVLKKGLIKYCEKNLLTWIPSYVRRNPPNNPKVIIGWGKSWNQLPDCSLKAESYSGIRQSIQDIRPDWVKAFDDSFERVCDRVSERVSDRVCERVCDSPFEQYVQGSEFKVQSSGFSDVANATSCPVPKSFEPNTSKERAILDAIQKHFGDRLEKIKPDKVEKMVVALAGDVYPSVDVPYEIERAGNWEVANPSKKKRPGGLAKFLIGWMDRNQNNPNRQLSVVNGGFTQETKAERHQRLNDEALDQFLLED